MWRSAAACTMSRVFVRELAHHNCLRPRHFDSSRSVSTVADGVAGVQKGRRKRALGFALAGVSIVGGTYYAMTRVPQPSPLPPAQAIPPPGPALAVQPPSPFAPPEVSARVELLQRMDSLQSELEALRKQKRDKLIDMKKQAIKEDIQTIQSGLAALDKQAS